MIRIQPDPNPDPKHWLKLKEILKYVEEIAKDRPSHWQLIDINPLKGEQVFRYCGISTEFRATFVTFFKNC